MSEDRKSVLIVDDQANWRNLLKQLLEEDYDVTNVASYREALAALWVQEPPFHVAVVDIRLDDSNPQNDDGLKLVKELSRRGAYINAIVVTGYPDAQTAKAAFRDLGAFEYLLKYPKDGKAFDHKQFKEIVANAARDADKRQQPRAGLKAHMSNGILIVAATKVEIQAIREVFCKAAGKDWRRRHIGSKTYYDLGAHGDTPVFMVQTEMGTSTLGGALMTVRQAIQDLHPQAVIMCGIAFGLRPDKQQLGDILVAKQLEHYEPQKVDIQHGQMPRGDRATASERLLDRFRSGDHDWKGAKTHFGLVLSGEKLVNDPTFRDWLLKNAPEAIGGEMEGAGLYVAAQDTKVDWILVKAICDWADGDKNDDAQSMAALNASRFVLHVLKLGGWNQPE